MIWDWRSNSLIASIFNGYEANFISFNPLNSKELCSSGDGEHIKFWKLKISLKKSTLESRYIQKHCNFISIGSIFPEDSLNKSSENPFDKIHLDFDDQRVTPDLHLWLPTGMVLASSNQGNKAVSFDPSTGRCKAFLGGPSKSNERSLGSGIFVEEQEYIDESADDSISIGSNLKNMAALKTEILFAGSVR